MANTESQAQALIDLLIERLEIYDPTLDTGTGSSVYSQVIAPIEEALGVDPFDSDIVEFIKDRIRQEVPSIGLTDGNAIVSLMVRPLQLILEALKREAQIIRRGQSVKNADVMRIQDAKALAANFFIDIKAGGRAGGVVRVYYVSPTYVAATSTVTFTTSDGLRFYPSRPQFFTPEVMLLQQSGSYFYVDVNVVSELAGEEYNVAAGSVSQVSGLANAAKVTNLRAMSGGSREETSEELLTRASRSLVERSLTNRRGIIARLNDEFPTVRSYEVVGYGDPEMERDVLTGGGHGMVVSSGLCFIVGQFVFMVSMFEDRGLDGEDQVRAGDEIDLNYWGWLYDVKPENAHETFTIDDIIFDSRESITENLPSFLLFRLDGTPSAPAPASLTIPGSLPGVFCVIRREGVIEISDIPGGIVNPTTTRGTVQIADGEVHVGGHYDVWVRPGSDTEVSTDLGISRSNSYQVEGEDLYTAGDSSTFTNIVHREYVLTVSNTSGLVLGDLLTVAATGAQARIQTMTPTTITLYEMNGILIETGDTIVGSATMAVTGVEYYDAEALGVERGSVLSILSGSDEGAYRILKVDGPFIYVDVSLTVSEPALRFRILNEVTIDLVSPKEYIIPFGNQPGTSLRTTIGSATIRTSEDLQTYGAEVGDLLEITEGEDEGVYTITGWSSSYGGTGAVLSQQMSATNSGLTYTVYRQGNGIQRPLIRLQPGGVAILDQNGSDSGYVLPYALPVDGRALEAFSGARQTAYGLNGFVMTDPGVNFAPTSDVVVSPTFGGGAIAAGSPDVRMTESMSFEDCDGYIAVMTLMDNGDFWLDSGLPASASTWLQNMYDWATEVIDTFGLGTDLQAFVDAFHPFKLGTPDTTVANILLQFEICIPYSLFDGCNNVFIALPEFDWESEFSEDGLTFEQAMDKFNNGTWTTFYDQPALSGVEPGDAITVIDGPNQGGYIVDQVHLFKIGHAGAIVGGAADPDLFYDVVVCTIKSTFPVAPFSGITEFFDSGIPALSVPAPPSFDVTITDNVTGNPVSPWQMMSLFFTWFFQWLNSMGFDLPDSVTLDKEETLKSLWQMCFTPYAYGRPTAAQYARMTFVEPTSVTAYNLEACTSYSWAPPAGAEATVTSYDITVPWSDLVGVSATILVDLLSGMQTVSGTLTADVGTATTVSDLADTLQADLDPSETYLTFTGPTTATGALTITSVDSGIDVAISVDAEDSEDAFRGVGFFDDEGERWARMWESNVPSENYRDLTFAALGGFKFSGVNFTGGGPFSADVKWAAGTYDFDAILTKIQTDLDAAVKLVVADASVTTSYEATGDGTWAIRINVDSGSDTVAVSLPAVGAPTADADYSVELFGSSGTGGTTATTAYYFGEGVAGVGNLELAVYDGTTTYTCTHTWASFAAYKASDIPDALQNVIDNTGSGDEYNDLAIALNALTDAINDGTRRRAWFVGGASLEVRGEYGGVASTLALKYDTDFGYYRVGFVSGSVTDDSGVVTTAASKLTSYGTTPANNTKDRGSTSAGTTQIDKYTPESPTLFSVAVGGAEILYAATQTDEPYQVFPGQDSAGTKPVTDLPRDIRVGYSYSGSLSTKVMFTDEEYSAPISLDIRAGSDWLWVYEQRVLLDHTISDHEYEIDHDRVIAVKVTYGSNQLELPEMDSPDFDFMDAQSGYPYDEVDVGDIVYIEEGADAGGYLVTARTENILTISGSMTESSGVVYKVGNDGTIAEGATELQSATSLFTSDDVGRYLTIWGCNRPDYDGCFLITAVTDYGTHTTAALDTDVFPKAEANIHWAVVKAPSETPGDSGIDGRTELVGVRPIRVYNGTPTEWRVAEVSGHLDRLLGYVNVVNETSGTGPRRAYFQPYQFVRPGVQHISSTAMKGQGRENGLYYFDVLAVSLGGDSVHNIPSGTRMEPIYGTYESDGYELQVEDYRLSFSPNEEVSMVVSPMVLPVGLEDVVSNKLVMEGRELNITYDYSPAVLQIQEFLLSDQDRTLCANPLARHLLPAYVYLDVRYVGGNSVQTVAQDIIEHIEGLNASDVLDLSVLEKKTLFTSNISSYAHPITLITVTHDQDRRLIGTRSSDKISDDEIAFNGSNRTTFFIPGENRSTAESEAEIPDGERVYLYRGSSSGTIT